MGVGTERRRFKGQPLREEELGESQAPGPPGEPVRLGSCWGRGGGQAGGWTGRGLERLRPEAAFSTRKGRGAREQLPS